MSDAELHVLGAELVARNLDGLVPEMYRALLVGMLEEGEETVTLAKEKTPVRFGNLRASGRVEPDLAGGRIRLAFGGGTVGYAWYVHERTELRHHVGQAKFLSAALEERRPGRAERIAAGMNAAARRHLAGGTA